MKCNMTITKEIYIHKLCHRKHAGCELVALNAFTHLFTKDVVANDCRVFDWDTALNKH